MRFLRIKSPKRTTAPGRLPADPECVQRAEIERARVASTPLVAAGGLLQTPCGIGMSLTGDSLTFTSKGTTIAELAQRIGVLLREPVEDQTGIRDYFGLKLTMGADQDPVYRQLVSSAPTSGPSLETALADDLNLMLVSGKTSVHAIVIEHMDLPTPD